jgi:hypothetical protein
MRTSSCTTRLSTASGGLGSARTRPNAVSASAKRLVPHGPLELSRADEMAIERRAADPRGVGHEHRRLLGAEFKAELQRGRQIDAGHPPEQEPFLEPRDTRKIE